MQGFTPLDVRLDIEANPWTEVDKSRALHGLVKSVGFLRHATASGRGGIALLIVLEDGRYVIAETTYRLAAAAARVIAASPAVAEEVPD